MHIVWIFNGIVLTMLIVYYFINHKKSFEALDLAWKSFKKITPLLLIIIFFILVIQQIFTKEVFMQSLKSYTGLQGYIFAGLFGAIIHIPLFVSVPLGGELLQGGINPGIIAALITSLVMVHTFSIPVEIKEMGFKFAITRNLLTLVFAIVIGLIMGVVY